MLFSRIELPSLIGIFILGVGFALGLPPIGWWWLAIPCAALVQLLEMRSLSETHRRLTFLRGLFFGLGYFVFAFHWIGFAFLVDAGTYLWMMPFAVGGLSLFIATYWAAAFLAARWLWQRAIPHWLSLPAMLGLAELLRGYLFTGFPWASPGLVADGMGGVLQLASLMGMPGLTVMVLLWSAAPTAFFSRHTGAGAVRLIALCIMVSLPLSWWWGAQRSGNGTPSSTDGPIIRLVQPNISQSDKWRNDNAAEIFDTLLELSRQIAKKRPDVVIWPESAVPILLDENDRAQQLVGDDLAAGQTLVTGAIRRTTVGGQEKYFTSILTLNDAGRVVGRYDKWRLVPGGEYLPLAWLLEPLGFRKLVSLPESFTAGSGPGGGEVAPVGRAAMLICYEAIFPHHLVAHGSRPRWIINVTNDGWFGTSVGPYQHLAQVRMRAVEQGLPIARAANTGISAMIDGYGNIISSAPLEKSTFIDAPLPDVVPETLYSRFAIGPFTFVFLLLIAISSFATNLPLKVRGGKDVFN